MRFAVFPSGQVLAAQGDFTADTGADDTCADTTGDFTADTSADDTGADASDGDPSDTGNPVSGLPETGSGSGLNNFVWPITGVGVVLILLAGQYVTTIIRGRDNA